MHCIDAVVIVKLFNHGPKVNDAQKHSHVDSLYRFEAPINCGFVLNILNIGLDSALTNKSIPVGEQSDLVWLTK